MNRPASTALSCLIFDLFGVLVAFDDSLVYDRISQHCARPRETYRKMVGLVSDADLIRGKRRLEDVYDRLCEELGLSISFEQFSSLWRQPYSEPMPGIRRMLRELHDQCKLVLLSNVDRYYWSVVEASLPELSYFSALQLSCEQGIAKPEPDAFLRAVAASGAPASECLLVDDKPESLAAASAVGLIGHLFRSTLGFQRILRPRGLRLA